MPLNLYNYTRSREIHFKFHATLFFIKLIVILHPRSMMGPRFEICHTCIFIKQQLFLSGAMHVSRKSNYSDTFRLWALSEKGTQEQNEKDETDPVLHKAYRWQPAPTGDVIKKSAVICYNFQSKLCRLLIFTQLKATLHREIERTKK